MNYQVTWEIDIEADSPREAAERALAIQRDSESMATVFEVRWSDSVPGEDRVHIGTVDLGYKR